MIRILIADDHAILRAGLKQIIADAGDMIVAGEAENGLEALAKVREQDLDMVVLDMSMPGKSGVELIKQIKSEKPKLPILILSMHKEEQYAVRTLKAGASGYVCKDSASTQLVQAIRKIAAGGKFISAAVAEHLAMGLINPQQEGAAHILLSDREYQIFQFIAAGQSIGEIASRLNLSVKTVSTHKTRIMQKMNFANISEIVRYAIKHELIGEAGSPD